MSADKVATTRTIELSLVNRAATSPGLIPFDLNQDIDGVRQVDLVEWCMTGVAVTGGIPNDAYFTLDLGRLTGDRTESNGEPSGIKLFCTGQTNRQTYTNRTLLVTDVPFRVTRTQRGTLRTPDTRLATSSDYAFLGVTLRLYVDIL